jgi:integrase
MARLERGSLTIRRQAHRDTTKRESSKRTIPLPTPVQDLLVELDSAADRPAASPWVFPGRKIQDPVHASTVYHRVKDAIRAAGVPEVSFHDLRHSANNILKQLGVDAVTRKDVLGHSSVATTNNVYSQTVDSEMQCAFDKLESAIEGVARRSSA